MYCIGAFHLTETQIERFRLMRLFSSTRLSRNHFYVKAKQAAPLLGPASRDSDEDNDTSSPETLDNAEEDTTSTSTTDTSLPVIEAKNPTLIIVRMRSGTFFSSSYTFDQFKTCSFVFVFLLDLDMGTFLDRYHDYRDYCATHKIPAKIRVVQSGIGTISKSDVQVGIAAGKRK